MQLTMNAQELLQIRIIRSMKYLSGVYKTDANKTAKEIVRLRSGKVIIEFYQLLCDSYSLYAGPKYNRNYHSNMWDSVSMWAITEVGHKTLDSIFGEYSGQYGIVEDLRIVRACAFINGSRNTLVHMHGLGEGVVLNDISDSVMTSIAALYLCLCEKSAIEPPMTYKEFGKEYLNILRRCAR